MKKQIILAVALLFSILAQAEECLYEDLNGLKGDQIRTALYNHIKDHTVLSYSNLIPRYSGVDLRDNGKVWDMYSTCEFEKTNNCNSSNYDTEEFCECYNREHALPKSWWGHNSSSPEPMYTDLHHVIPTDNATNSKRSAWPLGKVTTIEWSNDAGSKLGYGTFGSNSSNKTFEPADEYKGDFARIYFYMATCYKDKDFTQGGKGYKVFNSGTADFNSTALNLYLQWHRNDPVSQKEIDRNNGVAKKQGNRNPFVDAPELVEYIWGNKQGQAVNFYNLTQSYGDPYDDSPTDVSNTQAENQTARKEIREGQIVIVRENASYTILGQPIR